MPDLDPKWFAGSAELPPDISTKLTIEDYHGLADRALTAMGWEGQLICAAGLSISQDGQLVQNGRFLARGALSTTPVPVKAAHLWEGVADNVMVHVTVPDCTNFPFSSGELCSDYLPQAAVKFVITRDGQPVLPTEWEQLKIGDFSLRLIAHLGKTSNGRTGPHFKLSVLMFPYSVDQLADLSDATQSVSWPGISILEGKSEFFPRAPLNFWGCPLFPLLNVQDRAANCADLPTSAHLRHAIGELMGSAARPTACKSRAGLKRKMDEMTADPEASDPVAPTVTWPPAPRPAISQGNLSVRVPTVYLSISTCSQVATRIPYSLSGAVHITSNYVNSFKRGVLLCCVGKG